VLGPLCEGRAGVEKYVPVNERRGGVVEVIPADVRGGTALLVGLNSILLQAQQIRTGRDYKISTLLEFGYVGRIRSIPRGGSISRGLPP